ncbi:hypothetical protein A6U97_27220 [Agrobacterium tumefaciens]|uniref:hypothetical protein n=1 Tax=Agrobacterium tumefaciens TaxID=358 RepID=UPI00080FCB4B|nr:hypothetical protein [Agrobacterium tumefaciens]NTA83584.1 hypothetical protein [Agrobacterium tumefaciens]OCJ66154.1 hypothetical protein A6U97_27220 [Agrobacterium tumefaciens]
MTDNNQIVQQGVLPPAERRQKMASALSAYARMLTFENRSRRNLYRLAGLAPHTRDKVFSILLLFCFALTFVLPMVASSVYYIFIASPRYASEVRFVLRSSAPMLSRDRYASSTIEPKAKIVQDTAVLLNYIDSPAMIQDLEKNISLKDFFGRDGIDRLSRLKSDANQDDVLKYWRKHYTVSVNPKSGIVELEVSGYTPQQARDLLQLVLHLSEQQVNKLSSGMWDDLLRTTQQDVDRSMREVGEFRGKLRDIQNATGVFDIDLSAERLSTVLTGVEANIADLESRRTALMQTVGRGAPQLSEIERRLKGLEAQAKELRESATGGQKDSLSGYATAFENAQLNLKLGEDKLKSAITDLEKVKLVSSLQLVYVDNFTQPTLPDYPKYPKLAVNLFLALLIFGSVAAATCGAIALMRNKLD